MLCVTIEPLNGVGDGEVWNKIGGRKAGGILSSVLPGKVEAIAYSSSVSVYVSRGTSGSTTMLDVVCFHSFFLRLCSVCRGGSCLWQ